MSILQLVITDAGYAALVNAELLGTDAIQIVEVGLTPDSFLAASSLTALPGEARRLTTIAGQPTGDNTINLVIRDDDEDVYSVRGFGLFLADGVLFATYSSEDLIVEKSGLASILITVDLAFDDIDTALIEFGDMSWTNPQATEEILGVVELATQAEAEAGTDPARVVTAKVMHDVLRARTISGGGLVTGGGNLTGDRVLTVTEASEIESIAGVISNKVVTPRRLKAAIDALVAGAPGALDTLNEIAAALGDDPDFVGTMIAQLALKASLTYVDAQLAAARLQILTERAGSFVWVGYDAAGLDAATMVLANGELANRVTDARLFTKFGTTFGAGDGATTFGLPEVRGEFFRALDLGRGIDAGRTHGSWVDQAIQSHSHSIPSYSDIGSANSFVEDADGSGTFRVTNTGATGGTETRPRSVAYPVAIWR